MKLYSHRASRSPHQRSFLNFHQKIKLDNFNQNSTLREKRDRILNRLRNKLELRFDWFNQGSYEMNTGVVPLDGDYDIDVGIVFDLNHFNYDPVEVKTWVYDAVKNHTADVQFRRPCVTVYYQHSGEKIYHVDLAIYVKSSRGLQLAVGKQYSGKDQREWLHSEAQDLTDLVNKHFSQQEDRSQFCRVIRYLKRWKDVHFPTNGNAAPVGIGLTLAAYNWLSPCGSGTEATYDDLTALRILIDQILANYTWDYGQSVPRLKVYIPVSPGNDVFERMTDQQMSEFKGRLERLRDWLNAEDFSRAFGADFPS